MSQATQMEDDYMESSTTSSSSSGVKADNKNDSELLNADYVIYFAKPEEIIYLDEIQIDNLTMIKSYNTESFIIRQYKYKEFNVFFTNGTKQGFFFPFEFTKFLHYLRPKHVIMCGICASSDENISLGDVIVGTHTRCLTGKLNNVDIIALEMDNAQESGLYMESEVLKIAKKSNSKIGGYLQSPFVLNIDFSHIMSKFIASDRRMIALDMEFWSFMHSCWNMMHRRYPVVKAVSDKGKGKTDIKHGDCIKNSITVALHLLERYIEIDSMSKLKRNNSLLGQSQDETPKRRRIIKTIKYSEIEINIKNKSDLELIQKSVIKYGDLTRTAFKYLKKLLTLESIKSIENIFGQLDNH